MLDGQGSIPVEGKIFLFSIKFRPALGSNQLPILGAIFPEVKLTTDHLVPRSRMVELYFHSLTCLHGMVLN
jgi:hypothetical protein